MVRAPGEKAIRSKRGQVLEIDAAMDTAPLNIEAIVYAGRRAAKCAVCKGDIKDGELAIRFGIGTTPQRRFHMHGAGCAMAALLEFMKKWNNINNGGGKWQERQLKHRKRKKHR